MTSIDHNETTSTLMRAVETLARPLVRLLVSKGITYPQFRDLLKQLYVEVAIEEVDRNGKSPSDSQLFILTGIHRKDIKRLRQQTSDEESQAGQTVTLSSAIVARWLGMKDYLDGNNQPRSLPRSGDESSPGFDQLVASVSKDVRPRAILDEWLRMNMVTLDDDGNIHLNQQAFIPSDDLNEQAWYLARNVHDHLAACAHNMRHLGKPMLERSVYYAKLTQASVEELEKSARKQANTVLQNLNKQALELQQQDQGLPDADYRMRFGCYWYDEKLDTEHSEQQEDIA